MVMMVMMVMMMRRKRMIVMMMTKEMMEIVATRMTNEKMTPRILILILFILKTVVSECGKADNNPLSLI